MRRLRHEPPDFEPRSFSFNSKYGACPACEGLGSRWDFDPAKLIVDWSKPLLDGGLGPAFGSAYWTRSAMDAAEANGFDLETPFGDLPKKAQTLILYGTPANGHRRRKSFPESSRCFRGTMKRRFRKVTASG